METDEVTQALRVYEKFYPSHNGVFGESKADTQASSNGLSKGKNMWLC